MNLTNINEDVARRALDMIRRYGTGGTLSGVPAGTLATTLGRFGLRGLLVPELGRYVAKLPGDYSMPQPELAVHESEDHACSALACVVLCSSVGELVPQSWRDQLSSHCQGMPAADQIGLRALAIVHSVERLSSSGLIPPMEGHLREIGVDVIESLWSRRPAAHGRNAGLGMGLY